MPIRPIEAERRTPVVNHEGDVAGHIQPVEQPVQVLAVFHEAVAAGAGFRELLRIAHADEVWRDAPPQSLQVRHHVAPQVRRGGIAVQEHDGVARAGLHIRHALAKNIGVALGIALQARDVHIRPQTRQEHRVRAGRVLQADGDDFLIGRGLPPATRRRQRGKPNDHVVVARLAAIRPLARPGRQHPALERLDGAHHAPLVFAEGVAIADIEVGDEVAGHGGLQARGNLGAIVPHADVLVTRCPADSLRVVTCRTSPAGRRPNPLPAIVTTQQRTLCDPNQLTR